MPRGVPATRDEKRELLSCLKSKLMIKDRIVYI